MEDSNEPFSLSLLLKKAGITEESDLKSYEFFLRYNKVTENSLSQVTEEKLEKRESDFKAELRKDESLKKEFYEFVGKEVRFVLGANTGAIAKAASEWSKKVYMSDLSSILEDLQKYCEGRIKLYSVDKKERIEIEKSRQEFISKMPFFGREKIEDEFLNQVILNRKLLFDNSNDLTHVKSFIKLPVLTGPPGIGKSTFGKRFPDLVGKKLDSKYLSIYLSFHSSQAFCTSNIDENLNPEQLISLRIFWYWFFKRNGLPLCWQAFVEKICSKFSNTWQVFSVSNVLNLIKKYIGCKYGELVTFIIHLDDVNDIAKYDLMNNLNGSKSTFYRILSGIGKCVFSSNKETYFIAPLVTGTTQIYINEAFEASDFTPLHHRLQLLSREESNKLISHYAGSVNWEQHPKFKACVEAVQGLPRALEELLWMIENRSGFWKLLNSVDYYSFFDSLKESMKSLYYHHWSKCTNELRTTLVLFALSGIYLPRNLEIEGLSLKKIEDSMNVIFEDNQDGSHCILQIPFIVLSNFISEVNLPHSLYHWLKLPGYINGPVFEEVDGCFEELLGIARKRLESYISKNLDTKTVESKDKNPRIRIGEYYRGAIGRPETLQISFKLPKEYDYVESIVQIAPSPKIPNDTQNKKSVGKKSKQKEKKKSVDKKSKQKEKKSDVAENFIEQKFVGQDRLLLNLAVNEIPVLDQEEIVLRNWTRGAIIRNGPYAPSWDICRCVYSDELKNVVIAKQLKYMAKKQFLTMKTPEERIEGFLAECHNEHKKVVETIKKMENDRHEEWNYIFVYVTNHPIDTSLLDILKLPENTIIYCEKNLQKFYSQVIYSRLVPWMEDEKVVELLEKLKVDD